jgi:hypothetical protein
MKMENSNSTFKRRKFTITESLDDVLKDLADGNYQGNVSLCIRAAIEDHRKTLNGTDSGLATRKLLQRVDKLTAQQEQIINALDSLEDGLNQESTGSERHSVQIRGLSDEANQILSVLENERTGLRIDDFADRLNLPTARIQPALGILVDRGMVIPDGKTPTRFHLAGLLNHDIQGV